jgi:ATP-dependent Clp protease ATP-binding subunit ClpB
MTRTGAPQDELRSKATEELRAYFRPEFLNRLDEIIVFHPLGREHIQSIVEIQLNQLRKRLAERKITLELTDSVRSKLALEGYDPVYGARPLKRVIQQRLQNPLAMKLLQGEIHDGQHLLVDLKPNREFQFSPSE